MNSQIEAFITKPSGVFVIVKGVERELRQLDNGKYIFVSTKKILPETIIVSPWNKPTKYGNIFSKEDQEKINKFMVS